MFKQSKCIFLFYLIFLIENITNQNICHTNKEIDRRIERYTFFSNRPVYKDYVTYTYITCDENVRIAKGNPLPTDQNGKNAMGLKFLNVLKSLENVLLNNLTGLMELYLNNTHLETIEPEALWTLNNLKKLYLQDNNISSLNSESLSGLQSLTLLNISNNSLARIESDFFKSLFNLKELYLGYNKINFINRSSLLSMPELIKIDLSNNNITYLDTNLFTRQNKLSYIALNNNSIKILPNNLFGHITKMNYLDLSHNLISSINFTELRGTVKLSNNQITTLTEIGSNITELNLGYNKIQSLPNYIFKNTEKLQILYLNNNNIENINEDAFWGLDSLNFLYLQNNNIRHIIIGTFRELNFLNTLNLSSNNINNLEYGLFSGLHKLNKLDLTNNKIAFLQVYSLYPLRNLRELNIDGNFIGAFDVQKLATNFPNLKFISMDNNRMTCEWLTNCIHILYQHNIKVMFSNSFKKNNVQGISCFAINNVPVQRPENVTKVPIRNTTLISQNITTNPTTKSTNFTKSISITTAATFTKEMNPTDIIKRVKKYEGEQRVSEDDIETIEYNLLLKINTNTKDFRMLKEIYALIILLCVLTCLVLVGQLTNFSRKYLYRKNTQIIGDGWFPNAIKIKPTPSELFPKKLKI